MWVGVDGMNPGWKSVEFEVWNSLHEPVEQPPGCGKDPLWDDLGGCVTVLGWTLDIGTVKWKEMKGPTIPWRRGLHVYSRPCRNGRICRTGKSKSMLRTLVMHDQRRCLLRQTAKLTLHRVSAVTQDEIRATGDTGGDRRMKGQGKTHMLGRKREKRKKSD